MLSARLILLVSATNLICDDSLGGEPNDKIDQVLAEIVRMNKNLVTLTNKVNGVEKKVDGIEDKVDDVIKKEGELENQVNDVTKQVGEVKKQVEKVDNDVIYNRWKFVGRGWAGAYDDEVGKPSTTMKECVEFCQTKRSSDGDTWNAVAWRVSNGHCYCEKNDRGHHEDSEYLHFRAQ